MSEIVYQPVLGEPRLQVAMLAMLRYCDGKECAECDFCLKEGGNVMCNFTAKNMHDAFAALKANGLVVPEGKRGTHERGKGETKESSVLVRLNQADRQKLSEISALTGQTASVIVRDAIRKAHSADRGNRAQNTFKWRQSQSRKKDA